VIDSKKKHTIVTLKDLTGRFSPYYEKERTTKTVRIKAFYIFG
jgi:hypothetical protein